MRGASFFSAGKSMKMLLSEMSFGKLFFLESDKFSLDSTDRDSLNSFPMATDGEALENQTWRARLVSVKTSFEIGMPCCMLWHHGFFCRVSVIFDVQMRLILGSSDTKYTFIPLQRSSTTILKSKSENLSVMTPEIGSRKVCTECSYYTQTDIETLPRQE